MNKITEFLLETQVNSQWWPSNVFTTKRECLDVLKHRKKVDKGVKWRAVKRTITEKIIDN